MVRFAVVAALVVAAAGLIALAVLTGWGWWIPALVVAALAAVGVYDLFQRRHSVLRNYPVLGHMRYLLEALRPELQQYFIERNFDGRPYDRDVRSLIYERAKGTAGRVIVRYRARHRRGRLRVPGAFDRGGRPANGAVPGPHRRPALHPPVRHGVTERFLDEFGALSANALRALNAGARQGGFAHDTGEGGLTPYHLGGADVVWEIGSGYFGTRTQGRALRPAPVR